MEKQRVEDMDKVLKLNNSIDKMYKLMCELELKGEKDSEQYKEYIELIRFAAKRCEQYMLNYRLSDTPINEYINLLYELNNYPINPTDYVDPVRNTKIKRFIAHNYELSLMYHDAEDDYDEDGVTIEGIKYDFETGAMIAEEEGYEDQVEDLKFLAQKQQEERAQAIDRDDLNHAAIELEVHTFIRYLLDAIEEEKNAKIKKKLIEAKYRVIAEIRSLELSFLYDQDLNIDLYEYQSKLHDVFRKRKELYLEYALYLEAVIDSERTQIIDRHKEKYDNIDDQVYNILLSLLVKTHISCMPNETVRQGIMEDNDAGIELAEGSIDKKVLRKSNKLNSKYIIYDINK